MKKQHFKIFNNRMYVNKEKNNFSCKYQFPLALIYKLLTNVKSNNYSEMKWTVIIRRRLNLLPSENKFWTFETHKEGDSTKIKELIGWVSAGDILHPQDFPWQFCKKMEFNFSWSLGKNFMDQGQTIFDLRPFRITASTFMHGGKN